MSDFKPGDRVRVEFEAKILRASAKYLDLEADNGEYCFQQIERCTLIEPEIVLPEIPGTIVQVDPLNEHNARLAFENVENDGRSWSESGEIAIWSTSELIDQCRRYGYRVIPAAEAEES